VCIDTIRLAIKLRGNHAAEVMALRSREASHASRQTRPKRTVSGVGRALLCVT
jgi:hypothetical protein